MRSLGLPELLIIVALIVLFLGGKRISGLFEELGKRARSAADQARWVYESLGGSEEDELRAEEKVGGELAERFLAQMPRDPDDGLQERVARIGQQLSKTQGARRRSFRFNVVAAPEANAYALPGGYVFVTRLLLDLCGGDEDETACLLAHEMAHVIRGHLAEQKVVDTLLGSVRAGRLATELLGKGYSREQEREADLTAVDLASEAGFDPGAALRLLEKLRRITPDTVEFARYFSTHPSTDERLGYVAGKISTAASG